MDNEEISRDLSCQTSGAAAEGHAMSDRSPRFSSHADCCDSVGDRVRKGVSVSGLSDSVLPGYLTLTERVLVFLEGSNRGITAIDRWLKSLPKDAPNE